MVKKLTLLLSLTFANISIADESLKNIGAARYETNLGQTLKGSHHWGLITHGKSHWGLGFDFGILTLDDKESDSARIGTEWALSVLFSLGHSPNWTHNILLNTGYTDLSTGSSHDADHYYAEGGYSILYSLGTSFKCGPYLFGRKRYLQEDGDVFKGNEIKTFEVFPAIGLTITH